MKSIFFYNKSAWLTLPPCFQIFSYHKCPSFTDNVSYYHPFHKHLLSTYYVPGTNQAGYWDTKVDKRDLALKSWLSCCLGRRHCRLSKSCSPSSQILKAFPCDCLLPLIVRIIQGNPNSLNQETQVDCLCFRNLLSQWFFFYFDLGDALKWLINITVRKPIITTTSSCTLSGINKFSQMLSWFGLNFDFIF